jgi:4-methyl-5(b-hydroxyethyl)-thiazole monophosphate biosynthesis
MKKALVFLAEGYEEVEAVTPIDFLRRAGIEVVVVGIGGKRITGANGLEITSDISISDLDSALAESSDILIFPGGMPGASNIASESKVISLINEYNSKGKLLSAICASPAVVLAPTGVLDGKTATCYPGMEEGFGPETQYSTESVVIDDNIITSRGPATAMAFSYVIVKILAGRQAADELISKALYKL